MPRSHLFKSLTSSYARAVVAVAMGGLVGSTARSGIGMMIPATESGFPISIVVVIDHILTTLDEMIRDGLITIERVDVRVSRADKA